MLFARRNQCFARIIHANFIFWRSTECFPLSPSWTTGSIAECGGWYIPAATTIPGTALRWTMARNVSASRAFPIRCCAAGFGQRCCRRQGAGSRPVSPTGQETVLRVQRTVSARLQPRQILPELCRCHEAQKRRCAQAETAAAMSRFRSEKSLVNQGLSERCRWVCDTFPIRARKAALKGV